MSNRLLIKKSSVATKVPVAGDLEYGELAINYTDEKIYFKNASNVIRSFNALSGAGTVTSVAGAGTVSGLTLTGTVTSSGSLTLGGTLAVLPSNFASQTANTVLAAPDGAAGTPTFRNLTLNDLPDAWVKKAVGAATTAALTINTAQVTIDGVTLADSTRVLIKNQAAAGENGIYTGVTTTTWVRTPDADTASEIAGAFVNVDAGTVNGGRIFDNDFKSTDTLGTTAMTWSQNVDVGYFTTVGNSFTTLANPTAITFPRINADNTVSALAAAAFRTAIGAGTSSTTGTVTSVAALTIGTTGTDVASTVATGTTTPVITLNIPTASAVNRGALSSADWTTFNNKVGSLTDTLATVTGRGATTATASTFSGGLTASGGLTVSGGWTYLGQYNTQAYPTAGKGLALSFNWSAGNVDQNVWNTTDPVTYTGTGIRFMQLLTASTFRDLMFMRQDGALSFGGINNIGTAGQVLQSNAAAAPTWVNHVSTIAATTPIVTSAATGAITLSHATSGVTAGTYNNTTVNATGHVTAGSNVAYYHSGNVPPYPAEADTLATVTARGNTTTTSIQASNLNPAYTVSDFDAIKAPGLYQYDGAMTSTPNSDANYRTIEIGSSTRYSQIALNYSSDGMWFRRRTDAVWSTWRQVWHSGNLTNLNQLTNGPGYGTGTVTAVTATTPIISSGGTTPNITHATSGATAGTYNNVTVNTFGHVTAGSNVGYISGYTETDTLATVTARGASTSTAVTLSSGANHYMGHFYYDPYDAAGNHYPHFTDGGSASGSKINWRLFTGATNSVTHTWTTSLATFATNIAASNFSGSSSGTNTGDNPGVTSVAGVTPIVSSGGNTPSISHATSGVSAGTYNNVTVNATGHVTAGSNAAYLTAEADTLATVTARGNVATSHLIIPSGEGNALGFWGGATTYSLTMGVSGSTYQYGTVTDYSLKMSMGGGAGRGFTWGQNGVTPIASLNSTSGNMQIAGTFSALSKSFLIDHPTKLGMQLRYGSLEGPENGVYIRGRLKGNKIELPEYWTKLVDPDSITVNLTAIGKSQDIYVEDIIDNVVYVGGENVNCFYTVYAERVDIAKLEVEIG